MEVDSSELIREQEVAVRTEGDVDDRKRIGGAISEARRRCAIATRLVEHLDSEFEQWMRVRLDAIRDELGVRVNLIGHTTTKAGLRIQAELDASAYRKGIKVSDEEMAAINLEKDSFHGEWNYTITPRA